MRFKLAPSLLYIMGRENQLGENMKYQSLSYSKWLAVGLLAGSIAHAQTPGTGTAQGTDTKTSVSTNNTVTPPATVMSVSEFQNNKLELVFEGDSLHPKGSVHTECSTFVALASPDSSRQAPGSSDENKTFESKEDLDKHSANVGLAMGWIPSKYKSLSECESANKSSNEFTDLADLSKLSKSVLESDEPAVGGLYDGKKILTVKPQPKSANYVKFEGMLTICDSCGYKKQIDSLVASIKLFPYLAPLLAPLLDKAIAEQDDKIAKAKTEGDYKRISETLASYAKLINDYDFDSEKKESLRTSLGERYSKVAEGSLCLVDDAITSAKSPNDLKAAREKVSTIVSNAGNFSVDQSVKDSIVSSGANRLEKMKEKAETQIAEDTANSGKYMDFIADTYGTAATMTRDKDLRAKFMAAKKDYSAGSDFRLEHLSEVNPNNDEVRSFMDNGPKTLQKLYAKRAQACSRVVNARQMAQCKTAAVEYAGTQKKLETLAGRFMFSQQRESEENKMNAFLQREAQRQQAGGMFNRNGGSRTASVQGNVFGLDPNVFPNAQPYNNSLYTAALVNQNQQLPSQYNFNTSITQPNQNSQYKVNSTPTVAVPLDLNYLQNSSSGSFPLDSGFNFSSGFTS